MFPEVSAAALPTSSLDGITGQCGAMFSQPIKAAPSIGCSTQGANPCYRQHSPVGFTANNATAATLPSSQVAVATRLADAGAAETIFSDWLGWQAGENAVTRTASRVGAKQLAQQTASLPAKIPTTGDAVPMTGVLPPQLQAAESTEVGAARQTVTAVSPRRHSKPSFLVPAPLHKRPTGQKTPPDTLGDYIDQVTVIDALLQMATEHVVNVLEQPFVELDGMSPNQFWQRCTELDHSNQPKAIVEQQVFHQRLTDFMCALKAELVSSTRFEVFP